MIQFIKNLFKPRIVLTGRQINMWEHKSWGNSIKWMDFDRRKIYGHLFERPRKGDVINCEMNSGKVMQFLVTDVEYCADPADMFFCDVKDFGYREPV